MPARGASTIVLLGLLAACSTPPPPPPQAEAPPLPKAAPEPAAQVGVASYYGPEFTGRKTASGTRFNPHANVAAHRHLPLGTTAKVTNLENGRSATVKVEDRGPYIRGRIIDLSPRVAETLGMKHQGLAQVAVQAIDVPGEPARPAPQEQAQAGD